MDFWDQHKTITCFYEKAGEEVCKKYGISQMEYDILMFIDANPQYATAADIVRVRKSAKSHVSTSLKRLEEKGYIERKADEKNKKIVTIHVLDTAKPLIQEGREAQKHFMHMLSKGISHEEMMMFKDCFEKLCRNAEEMLREK